MTINVVVIDTKVSNIINILSVLRFLGIKFDVIDDNKDLSKYQKMILPGVGNFGKFVSNLQNKNLINKIKDFIENEKYFLGICSGMQFLFQTSEESKNSKGLGIIDGDVRKFDYKICGKVPLIGKKKIIINKIFSKDLLLQDIKNEEFYFLHSYHCKTPKENELTSTNYDEFNFTSSVKKGKVYGVQFHPEKSHNQGVRLFQNFINLK